MTPYSGLELLSTAVLLLDESLQGTYATPAAETLFAHGRQHLVGAMLDKAIPGNDAFLQRWREIYPTAAVTRIEDAGHYVLEDAAEQVVPQLAAFFAP